MMTNHPSRDELFAYRDGELEHEARGLVEAHVLSCTACSDLLEAMSDAEGLLRQQHEEPDDDYFESLTRSVMQRVAPGATERAAGRAPSRATADEAPPPRAARRRSLEEDPSGRAPRLPWPAIVSTVSAAAAVLVVVLILFQKQEVWRSHGPVAATEPPAEKKAESAAPSPEAAGGESRGLGALEAPPSEAPAADGKDLAEKSKEDRSEAAPGLAAPGAPATNAPSEPLAKRNDAEIKTENAADALPQAVAQKSALARSGAPSEAPAGAAAAPENSSEGESGFPPVAARYGLPLLYDPNRVSSDALLRAEPDLRYIYQTGRAGSDSARVRLYLAEAARARTGDAPDAETYDAIVHHYRRALRLARDPETARTIQERFDDFVSRVAPAH